MAKKAPVSKDQGDKSKGGGKKPKVKGGKKNKK